MRKGKEGVQFGVFAAEVFEHLLVGGAEIVDVGFSKGGPGKLNVLPSSVRGYVEALSLEQPVRLHAPVLVRRAHHRVSQLHLRSITQFTDSPYFAVILI